MTKYAPLALLLVTALGAAPSLGCGDNADDGDNSNDADGDADGDTDDSDDVTPDANPATPSRAVVVAGDFAPGAPGVLSMLDLEDRTVDQNVAQAGAISSDPMVRKIGDKLYVVNRAGGNNVTVLAASDAAFDQQIGTGDNSNPQDVAVVGTKLYLPAMGTAGVVVATLGSTTTTTIAFPAIDPDGKPDCVSAIAVGTDVYVACGTLDDQFVARGPGKVVVINSATDTIKATLTLANNNPFGVFEKLPNGDLVIPTVPNFGDLTMGCLEKVVPGATPTAGTCLLQNTDLGGYAIRASSQELTDGSLLWLAVAVSFTEANLRGYDLGSSTLWNGSISTVGQISDVAACPDGSVVAADQTMAANGLRVYVDATEVTTAPLAVGLAPKATHGLECY